MCAIEDSFKQALGFPPSKADELEAKDLVNNLQLIVRNLI